MLTKAGPQSTSRHAGATGTAGLRGRLRLAAIRSASAIVSGGIGAKLATDQGGNCRLGLGERSPAAA
jgi:hypothetical protein